MSVGAGPEDRVAGVPGVEGGPEDRSDAADPHDEDVPGDRSEEFARVEVAPAAGGYPAPRIYFADNLQVLPGLADGSFELIYVDPPFNTGRTQARTQMRMVPDADGDRTGFSGRRYRTIKLGTRAYADVFDDYLEFLWPRLEQAYRLLAPTGSFFLHLDYREVHYAKVALDQIFGRACFMNEIVWAYDYGARSRSRWSAKHDNILWYAKDPARYTFEYAAIDRIPYMAPGLVGPEKAKRGKTPTDTWWSTIVSPSGKEKTGYPTQKPLRVVERIVRVHSRVGDRLLDFFAGSGTFGEAAVRLGREVTLIDDNPEAIEVMRRRLGFAAPVVWTPGGRSDDASVEHAPDEHAHPGEADDLRGEAGEAQGGREGAAGGDVEGALQHAGAEVGEGEGVEQRRAGLDDGGGEDDGGEQR